MKKVTTLLMVILLLSAMTSFAQVNFTANDVITPYEGYYHPGINPGYYGSNWDDNTLADIAVGNETVGATGLGIKSLRGALPEGIGQTFTYDIWIDKYDYNNALGTSDNLLFLGFASEAHKDKTDYCPSDDFQTDMFANLYEPIWDNGENGTPVNDENYYALYVYEVVSRLKDKVRFWEIWNEPGFDFTGAKGFLPPGAPGNWWENNPDPCDYKLRAPIFNYIRTLRISYEVIKSIDPDGYVCVAGLGYDSFLDALLRNTDNPDDGKVTAEYPLGAGAYFDVVGFHAYPHIDGSTRYWDTSINDFVYSRHSDASADALEVRRDARQEVLAAYGYDGVTYPKKEWIATEVNVPNRPLTQEMGSDEVQRNYAMKVNMKAMQLDFTQLHLYVLGDWKPEPEANNEFDLMGFYESLSEISPGQQKVKPAGIGLKTMSDALWETRYDAARSAQMNLGENIGGGAYKHDDGTYTYVLWAKTLTDLSEQASATYYFPQSFGLTAMIRKEWDYSATGIRLGEGPGNIQLTSSPIFLRKLEEDQDIFLNVSCNVDVELQNTATTPEGGKVISWPDPTATTNCFSGVTIEQTQGIANGSFFPFGVHEIQYTITNECGDKKYCAFNVKVASTGGGIGDCNLFRWEMGFIGQFNGNKYFLSAVKKDFAAAQAQAEGHGGYLVSIDSPEENEFLRQQAYALGFIGYNDVAQEGTLEWTSGKPVVYTNVADCQGCQNSDAGDVAMFNHFNGEWYFVPATATEFFIMELPCAEVPPCICTTEYMPVCAPDGTEYSNSCFAECAGIFDYQDCTPCVCDAEYDPVCGPDGTEYSNSCIAECEGVFDYGACLAPCDLSQQVWLQDTLASDLCADFCLGNIASFEFNDSTYVIFQPEAGFCADDFTNIYNCEGTLICQDGGFAGLTECADFFGMNFTFDNLDTLWSKSICPEPCGLDSQQWLSDKIAGLDCDSGVGSLESFEFLNNFYVLEYDYPGVELDGGWRVYNCDGSIFCSENPLIGQDECTDFFGPIAQTVTHILWSREVECNDCVCTTEVFPVCGSDGITYGNPCLAECEGIFEYTSGACGQSCLNLNEEWLATYLAGLECSSCVTYVKSFVYNDSIFLVEYTDVSSTCSEAGATIYDCDGNQFCIEGNNPPEYPCKDYFGEYWTLDSETLWAREVDCPDCNCITLYDPVCGSNGVTYSNSCVAECEGVFDYTVGECVESCLNINQEWLASFLNELECGGCVADVESFIYNDSIYVIAYSDFEICGDGGIVIYDCNGDEFCIESGLTLDAPCSAHFGNYTSFESELLWSKDSICICDLDAQQWLTDKIAGLDCDSGIGSLESFEFQGQFYVIEYDYPGVEADGGWRIYNCDGTLFCSENPFGLLTECSDFFGPVLNLTTTVLWSREVECEDCICTDEYAPVCGTDGITYGNSCEAECAGIFEYTQGECVESCLSINEEWLATYLSELDCNDCVAKVESFIFNDSIYVVAYEDFELCADVGTFIYDCNGDQFCFEGSKLPETPCTAYFGDYGSFDSEVLWSKESACIDTCVIDGQQWVEDLLSDTTLCGSCISTIELAEFEEGVTYIGVFEDEDLCDNPLLTVYSCDGSVFCIEGGINEATQCSEIFVEDFEPEVTVLWSRDSACVEECNLDEQEWLTELLSMDSLCSSCITSIESAQWQGTTYIGILPDESYCTDVQLEVYTCDGALICVEGGFDEATECTEFFGDDFDPETNVLWSKDEDCEDCQLENQDWITSYIESIDCNSGIEYVIVIENDGVKYILEQESLFLFPSIDYPAPYTTVYNCDGSVFCLDGGENSLSFDCTNAFMDNPFDAILDTLWIKSEDCEDCSIDSQVWVDSLLERPTLCEDCISSIEVYTIRDSTFVVAFADDVNCSDAQTIVYRCNGSTFCTDGGIAGSQECFQFFASADAGGVLWDRDSACIDNAVTALQVNRLSLFPNPAESVVNISFESGSALSLIYTVTNVTGQQILQGSTEGISGSNRLNFSVEQFVDGIYFVQLEDRKTGASKTLKFVVN